MTDERRTTQTAVAAAAGAARPPSRRGAASGFLLVLRLLRPRQWVKNLFVFAPLLFSSEFVHAGPVWRTFVAAAYFCLASSSAYIMNDLLDLEHDRSHPSKSRRALASGAVSTRQAWIVLAVLLVLTMTGFAFSPLMMAAVIGYLLLNLAYSLRLKSVPVVDIFCVAGGFVIRVYAGALAIDVSLSQWMLITTLCLTLYLAAGKRRHELMTNGNSSRKVLEHYSVHLIDLYAAMSAVGALVFYGIFTVMHRPELTVTIPLVIFGIFRYWFVVEKESGDDPPTDALVSDMWLMATVVAWLGVSFWALWP
jgi:decaprenyl-phosphate phosphoribosyltransferase